jgi:hypothetical protein
LTLNLGDNQLLLSSTDPAGNSSSTHMTIVRANTQAALTLTLSGAALHGDSHVNETDLPVTLVASAVVQDERGQPVDGAQVTFSLSPPNATTLTYKTTSAGGTAAWPELDIASVGDPQGTWLVTVLAVLPSGTELRANKAIQVR